MSLPVNATLIFEIIDKTKPKIIDGYGNPVPMTTTIVVLATMKIDGSIDKMLPSGFNVDEVRLKGRSVNPKILPVELPRSCKIEITDPVAGSKLEGTFNIDLPIQSKFKIVTKALGSAIEGTFIEDRGR